jgi:transcriptional regulator with XRE-family HTH domain
VPSPDFPDRLRRLREAKGLSQTQLGAAVGKTAQAVATWERGSRKPVDLVTLVRIAAALGVTLDELVGFTVDPHRLDVVTP